jgi:hypothetical protein
MNEMSELERVLEEDLLKLYGPVLSGEKLTKSLGYISQDAFRTSIARKTVPVPIFKMDGRRGYHALTKDVASFLAKARNQAKSGG